MFSGIVEEYATLVALVKDQENIHFTFKCSFVNELKIDQSISHNGVCLTVVTLTDDTYTVTAMKETLERSNLGLLKVGDKVNVERSMMMNGRLDGHIVQGHVDQTATCIDIKDAEGSWYFTFRYAFDKEMAKRGYITVDKGSVTVNGVSLTVCNPTDDTFQVAIIPYTYEHTNFHTFEIGSVVNIEFDIYHTANLKRMEVRMLVCIRNDSHLESIIRRITYRQTNTVHSHRTFIHGDISAFRHLLVKRISECKIPAAFRILNIDTSSSLIHMSLNDMSVQPTVHHHATFNVHLIPHFQQTEVRTLQCFFHGSHRIRIIRQSHYRQAYTIVRNTLVDFQLIHKRTLKCKVYILLVFHQCYQSSIFFYDSRKHNSIYYLRFYN